jgi:hypothetical protein
MCQVPQKIVKGVIISRLGFFLGNGKARVVELTLRSGGLGVVLAEWASAAKGIAASP